MFSFAILHNESEIGIQVEGFYGFFVNFGSLMFRGSSERGRSITLQQF